MNAILKKYITQDITNLIISINNFNMKLFNQRQTEKSIAIIFEKQTKGLEFNIMIVKTLSVIQSNSSNFLVNNNNVVNLNSKTCNCKIAFQEGFPCRHLCAVILFLGQDPNLYIKNINVLLFFKPSFLILNILFKYYLFIIL